MLDTATQRSADHSGRLRPETQAPRLDLAIRAVVVFVTVAAALYLALALWVGWRDLASSIAALGVLALATGAVVASLNYLLRFGRWHHILRRMSQKVPAAENLRVYLGGLALTATPGKIGETIRSALLLRWRVPVGASLAAFFIDRLTDLVGVLLLAALTGEVTVWWWLAGAVLAIGIALRWTFATHHAEKVAAWLERRHRLAMLVQFMRGGMAHYLAAWHLRPIITYALVALIAYGIQGLVFAYFVKALWSDAQIEAALHIFATSTLAGAASLIPGGLGAMELALIAQLSAAGMPVASATAAAVAVRAVTLWFGILVGLLCLLSYRRSAVAP